MSLLLAFHCLEALLSRLQPAISDDRAQPMRCMYYTTLALWLLEDNLTRLVWVRLFKSMTA